MDAIFAPTLAEAFDRAAMRYPEREPEPGKLSRFPTSERDRTDRAGWCKVFPDTDGAAFGDWRTGEAFTWQRRDTDAPPPSAHEREKVRQKAGEARRQAEQERAESYARAADECAALWQSYAAAPADHPYLTRKGIRPHCARIDSAGRLVLPVLDEAGNIQSLQTIAPDGSKRFHPGGKMTGGRLFIGKPADGSPLALEEGFATGASIREAAGVTVAVGFGGSNLRHVAESLRRLFPRSPLLVAGDLDAHGAGEKYARAAADVAQPARLALPFFKDNRPAGDFNDLLQTEGPEEVRRQILAALAPPSRFALLTAGEVAARPPIRWRVRGVLPEEGIGAVFGPSASGKSFLVLDLLAAVANGREWFDNSSRPAPVLYAALEGEAGIAQRLRAFTAKNGPLPDRFRVLLQSLDILKAGDRAELVAAARAAGVVGGVLCLDTLNRAAPGADENDGATMGDIIGAAKEMQAELGGLVLFVHHTGKDAAKGLRGHSSLFAALDAAIEVTRDGDRRTWKVAKSKDGDDDEAQPFRLRVMELGEDDEGEPVTSCTIEPEESTGEMMRRALPPKSGNQRTVYDGLNELLRAAGIGRPKDAPAELPTGRPCIRLEVAIQQTRSRLVCDPKRQTERAQAAIRGLVERGVIVHREGWLWIA